MQPEKYQGLSFLPKDLADAGYHNSFYYGGELDFANMKAYLLQSGISDLHDKSSYTKDEMNAKWGAHDEFVFRKQEREIGSKQQPFFSMILSLSSHEPFQVPMQTKFPGNDDPSKFKNSCYYTDHCIGEYMKSVSKEPWYKNTLFIFVADHGHILPRNRNPEEAARFHIPIIFYGEVLKPEFRGKKIEQHRNAEWLTRNASSRSFNLSDSSFHWSNDLLNFYRNNFAYYSFDSGFGFVNEDGSMRYDFNPATSLLWKASRKKLFSTRCRWRKSIFTKAVRRICFVLTASVIREMIQHIQILPGIVVSEISKSFLCPCFCKINFAQHLTAQVPCWSKLFLPLLNPVKCSVHSIFASHLPNRLWLLCAMQFS